ncbi:hypothetical protein GF407_15420 [candidate division KSB1 bacterium]|nr:hypothetical protein [candidate division KSB1 bacterium]
MKLSAQYVSADEAADIFQVIFAKNRDSDKDYLLIQRQFELPDDNRCYYEDGNNFENTGHYYVKKAFLRRNSLSIEIYRREDNKIFIEFQLSDHKFKRVRKFLQILIPNLEIVP